MRRIIPVAILAVGAVSGVACSDRPATPPTAAEATSAAEDYGLYCKEHGVPEKFCTLCHPELKGKLLLCKEHGGLPEEICTLCHPEAKDRYDIAMCPKGHGQPEHFCTECAKGPSAG